MGKGLFAPPLLAEADSKPGAATNYITCADALLQKKVVDSVSRQPGYLNIQMNASVVRAEGIEPSTYGLRNL